MFRQIKMTAIAIIFFMLVPALSLAATAPPDIKAHAAILMDMKTGQILFDKKMHNRSAPASTTKIMTAILAIESGRLDEVTTVSIRAAATRGSSMHLYAGQAISVRELLTGLMLRSGNDAAAAIAEHLAGSIDAFVEQMNRRALSLGATNTHYRNPHGLDTPGHYSTAHDLAWITRYALSNPIFAEIVSTKETAIEWLDRGGKERERDLRNTNKLLWMLEEADGVKTGTTGGAGPCLVSSATRGNHKLIAVVLNDPSRWYDSMRLLKYGFDNYDLYDFANQGDILATLPVEQGLATAIGAVVSAPAAILVSPDEYNRVTVEVELPEKIKAPVYQGQKIGEIIFFIDEKAVKTVDVVATHEVSERTAVKSFLDYLVRIFKFCSGWGVL